MLFRSSSRDRECVEIHLHLHASTRLRGIAQGQLVPSNLMTVSVAQQENQSRDRLGTTAVVLLLAVKYISLPTSHPALGSCVLLVCLSWATKVGGY